MGTHIGKQIRNHRLHCSMTQEKLASILNVSPQAVSKWENGVSYPDITLLPELSAALGVTIDELFEYSTLTHLRRIEQIMENETALDRETFDYAEQQLKEGSMDLALRGRCLTMLAELYNHRARMYHERAAEIAEQALDEEPGKHSNHSAYCEAVNGVFMDWCITNHSRIIDFYYDYIHKNPRDRAGYMWLMDNLIADGRLAEARSALDQMRSIKETYHYFLYLGWIARYENGWEAADAIWEQMVSKYSEDWHVWNCRADTWAKRAQYDKAIEDYRHAAELEASPRFTDNYDSIAQLCMLKGDEAGAAEAYEQVVRILREDWNMREGETVRGYLDSIAQLKK